MAQSIGAVAESEAPVRRVAYEDVELFAADVGGVGDASVEVIDGTVIVATADETLAEFDLPAGDAEAFIRNGVLTVEVRE